jgi:hypothetical protein
MLPPSHRDAVRRRQTRARPWFFVLLLTVGCSRRSVSVTSPQETGAPSARPSVPESHAWAPRDGGTDRGVVVAKVDASTLERPGTLDAGDVDAAALAAICGTPVEFEHKVVDPRDGGSCWTSCKGTCAYGRCVVVLHSDNNDADEIAADATDIYWTNIASYRKWYPGADEDSSGSVWKVSKNGGPAHQLAVAGAPRQLAVDSTGVYYESAYFGPFWRVPLGGGDAHRLAANEVRPRDRFSDGNNAYSVGSGDGGVSTLVRRPLDGGTSTTLTAGRRPLRIIGVDASTVYWVAQATAGGADTWDVISESTTGGPATVLATLPGCMQNIVRDGSDLYFSTGEYGDGQPSDNNHWGNVAKMPLRGGTVTTLAVMALLEGTPKSLVVDETSVYWTDSRGRVMKATPR